MNYREAYRILQAKCGIKVGDRVKVLRTFKLHELGCNAVWGNHKNLIGQTFKVIGIGVSDRSFALNIPTPRGWEGYNLFPFFVLEKVSSEIEITVKINGETRKLSDISEETLLNIRNKT